MGEGLLFLSSVLKKVSGEGLVFSLLGKSICRAEALSRAPGTPGKGWWGAVVGIWLCIVQCFFRSSLQFQEPQTNLEAVTVLGASHSLLLSSLGVEALTACLLEALVPLVAKGLQSLNDDLLLQPQETTSVLIYLGPSSPTISWVLSSPFYRCEN